MGTLSLFAFGSPARENDLGGSNVSVYPEVSVEIDGSVLSSSFFVTGSLVQYDFPTSFNDISGHNVRIHYLNDFAYASNIEGTDTLCFASSEGLENRCLFLAAVVLNMGVFSWGLGNFTPASNAASTLGFSAIQETSMSIPMDDFTALMGSNVQVRTNSSGLDQASVGTLWINGFVEFAL